MFIYKHKTTGAVVTSPTPCAGGNWELVNLPKAEKPADEEPKAKKPAAKRGK